MTHVPFSRPEFPASVEELYVWKIVALDRMCEFLNATYRMLLNGGLCVLIDRAHLRIALKPSSQDHDPDALSDSRHAHLVSCHRLPLLRWLLPLVRRFA